MSAGKQGQHVDATLPRTDAPEYPLDPADAAFLDPAAVTRAPRPAPAKTPAEAPAPAGYGDFEGERGRTGDAKGKGKG